MLNVDINQRIDFYQLYQNDYIKQLDLLQYEAQWYQDKKFLYPQRFSTLKLYSYIKTNLSSQTISTIANQITLSDEPQMKSIIIPKKQEILELKLNDDSSSKVFLFYLKIFCLKILLLEKMESLLENMAIIKEIKALKSQLELKFYYIVVVSFSLHNYQITEIFQYFKMSISDIIRLFRLKQDEEKNKMQILEDFKLQEFIEQNKITQFQNLDSNNTLIFLCCIYYSDPFTKEKIIEFIHNQNLKISFDDFPYHFYQQILEYNNQQFKNNLFNYLKEKYKYLQ